MKSKLLIIISLFLSGLQFSYAQNNMVGGKKDGLWNYYGSNKVLLARHFYSAGHPIGIWEFYTIKGDLSWTYNFNTSAATYILENTEHGSYAYMGDDGQWIKKTPSKPAIWLASQSQYNNFMVNNLKYHEESVPARLPGKVEIRVTIDENGNVTGYKIGNDIESDMDKEALRCVKLFGPEFVPAENNGKKVKSIYTLLVSYKLADYR